MNYRPEALEVGSTETQASWHGTSLPFCKSYYCPLFLRNNKVVTAFEVAALHT